MNLVQQRILALSKRLWRRRPDPDAQQAPLRAELLSAEQMDQHGRALAQRHALGALSSRDRLLLRLDDNQEALRRAVAVLASAVREKRQIAPAAEWLLDNFYLIDEQIRTARQHLPRGYSLELPLLAAGPSRGLPRVYDIALEAISHGDGRVDAAALTRFVAAYQDVVALNLGELWAIPIMLRLALIENLRRVSARIGAARLQLELATEWADKMMLSAQHDPKSLILVIADMARSQPPMASAFVAELARRLRGHGLELALPLTWIEQRLAESSRTIEQLVLAENQQQANDQVSISNTIGSLRFLGAMDWRTFVERMSHVEQILLRDPAQVYAAMDFASRDAYRHVIEGLAKRCAHSEQVIAERAVALAAESLDAASPSRHVGYFLLDRGLTALERQLHVRSSSARRARQLLDRAPLRVHVGAIVLLTLLLSTGALFLAAHHTVPAWPLYWLALPLLVAASQLASNLTNWLATLRATPLRLPRLDCTAGLPATLTTLVVVPTLLDSTAAIEALLEALEVRFIGNQDRHIHFALLTDWRDAATESTPTDAAQLACAVAGIEQLNARYQGAGPARFFLFHRARRFNPIEQLWMGYERKRGKLAALNALLQGEGEDQFSCIVGAISALPRVRYVITLDTDTLLPRDAARDLVGTMAHPLNRPVFDSAQRRIVRGYGILQPRMAATLAGAERSRYAQLCSNEPGIDPYTRSVSDVYQDLFHEGSFIGKGIYDVEAFEHSLKDRFPENRILSHDLLEGCFARSGLLSDVHLFEEYPARYWSDVARQRRWIRGDWQVASWALPWFPDASGRWVRNRLSMLSRFKIVDNLRRSLVPPALMMLLALGWTLSPTPALWSAIVLGIVFAPALLAALIDGLRLPPQVQLRVHLGGVAKATGQSLTLVLFRLACLPYEAAVNVDAILRTNWRMWISHRRLLEWAVAASNATNQDDLLSAYRRMWIAPITALAGIFVGWQQPTALWAMAPILLLWLLAPALARIISQPLLRTKEVLNPAQTRNLRRIARKTWAFFERFVSREDNWLPPDNFQEYLGPLLAHRTSPTNMGMALLANLSAWDFGYIGSNALLQRCGDTLATMARLERYQGHFYNWYDTRSLAPLPPRYVSTVDSGNLSGHLLTLEAGLLGVMDAPVINPQLFDGLNDTLAAIAETITPVPPKLAQLQALLNATLSLRPTAPQAIAQCLRELLLGAQRLRPLLKAAALQWHDALVAQAAGALTEVETLLATHHGDAMPTLREWAANDTAAALRVKLIQTLAQAAGSMAVVSWGFLYDRTRRLLAIGYNVDAMRLDSSFYDLLASEARLANFVAIANGELPQESWFALGRTQTARGGDPILLSWSGSMFEYLMPLLVMPSFAGTLLDQTCHAVVTRQIAWGAQHGVPWGVSESGYNTVDASQSYQYHAFGVPNIGLKRGLNDDRVVAPYASLLALMVSPLAAYDNLQRLSAAGLEGDYGYYEAADFTSARLPRGRSCAIVRSFMAHHQGMGLLALAHHLLGQPMQQRFSANLAVQATLLLLQERVPKNQVFHDRVSADAESSGWPDVTVNAAHAPMGAHTSSPEVQLLSNGRYQVMVSNAGGGYSRFDDLALTRWREDGTRDAFGTFIYLRDADSGAFWSTAHQPTCRRAGSYEAVFCQSRAEYRRSDGQIDTHCEIVVSPEDDIELRRVRISNRSRTRRRIELTSYTEVVLASQAADVLQPAFGNLFVQTALLPERNAIICSRRPRAPEEVSPLLFHRLTVHSEERDAVSFETDRMRFIGRGGSTMAPRAVTAGGALSGSHGAVLDPIMAIRCLVDLAPGETAIVDCVFGVAPTHAGCLTLLDKYHDPHLADRVFDLAASHAEVALRQLNATPHDAALYRRLGGAVIYANATMRADPAVLLQNHRGQSGLWGYAISGDLPIVLLRIGESSHIELVRQMIQCHAFWRMKGLRVDLVIWNEDHLSYRQRLHDQIMALVATGVTATAVDRPGGIFVRSGDQISQEDRVLLQAVARVIISDRQGSLIDQVNRQTLSESRVPRLHPLRAHRAEPIETVASASSNLQLDNGIGGFSADGREYLIRSTQQQRTPLPWVNVLANPQFASVISESGMAYTFSENAHELRLTPWSNDAVGSSGGEAIYLRDEESGHFWSPTPLPCPGAMPYLTRHGFGYSVFEHSCGGIHCELTVFVDAVDPVKFSVLTVRNGSGRNRKLSATGYVEWVLGDVRSKTAMHVVTEIDAASGALFARNAYLTEFPGRVAFFDVDDAARTLSGDRREFLGRNGALQQPEAMTRQRLSGRVGAGLDPCGAIQVPFELADGEERRIVFRLGAGVDQASAQRLAQRLRVPGAARQALAALHVHWRETLSQVQIKTPDAALNVLTNGWLVYQTLACRVWARSGFYQSGGAIGFRDQLQDTMALIHTKPSLLRTHLLLCASRQFVEGDVQHWWHPPLGRGVRTRCSDDYLWLPLAACRYVLCSGDAGVLDEQIPFLQGRALHSGEESYYDLPAVTPTTASLYQHCVRAIERALTFGAHGLPLMGSGDWNDGMNRVGSGGKGESVWLGFFLYRVLLDFATLAVQQQDPVFAQRCQHEAAALQQRLEASAWDGQWYLRAWFDDGSALGSQHNAECKIDSVAQSWAVLSGAAQPARAQRAMTAVSEHLVRRNDQLVQLLDPPFDLGLPNPGYIQGYLPGVRENGGQYTHAAIWAAMAFAELEQRERAWELLQMINPVRHGQNAAQVAIYKGEPYVVAADVYALAPHAGRAGWTWYTGSAGWLYRLILESLLGVRIENQQLHFAPRLPAAWPGVELSYRFKRTDYHIVVDKRSDALDATIGVMLDGVAQPGARITLQDDGAAHAVRVQIG